MNQTCQRCSYQSPSSARFCRQCGAQLIAETEFSSADTRNYVMQEPAPAVATVGSGHLPPSVADAIVGETARYYQTPYVPVPMASETSQIKSRIRHWRRGALALALLIGVTIGGMLT